MQAHALQVWRIYGPRTGDRQGHFMEGFGNLVRQTDGLGDEKIVIKDFTHIKIIFGRPSSFWEDNLVGSDVKA